jgi:hypothetical protein
VSRDRRGHLGKIQACRLEARAHDDDALWLLAVRGCCLCRGTSDDEHHQTQCGEQARQVTACRLARWTLKESPHNSRVHRRGRFIAYATPRGDSISPTYAFVVKQRSRSELYRLYTRT